MPAQKEDFIRLQQRRGGIGQTKDQDRLGKDLQAKGSTEARVLSLGRSRGCVAVVGNQWSTTGAVSNRGQSQKSTLLCSNRSSSGSGGGVVLKQSAKKVSMP